MKKIVNESLFSFLNEKIDKDHKAGIKIDGKDLEIDVNDLVKFAKKYPIKKVSVKSLRNKFGMWHKTKGITISLDGKWVKWEDLSDEQKKKQKEITKQDIMKVDLKYPIILSTKNNEVTSILDGNHRVEKAYLTDVKELKAYFIPEKDILNKYEIS